ncbi:uncharacterized protein LOC144559502 isoform X2 [Carex rostrata]
MTVVVLQIENDNTGGVFQIESAQRCCRSAIKEGWKTISANYKLQTGSKSGDFLGVAGLCVARDNKGLEMESLCLSFLSRCICIEMILSYLLPLLLRPVSVMELTSPR